jgi:hypothetical protein
MPKRKKAQQARLQNLANGRAKLAQNLRENGAGA